MTTVTKISTNTTYNYSNVDTWWHTNTTSETVIDVYFKDFINRSSKQNNKRELAAFLANISKETTGGWQTPVGGGSSGDYAQWGLYFVHEVGYSSTTSAGTYSQANAEYPPNANKGYYGRGPIQLSWNYNYGQFSKFIFNDKTVLLNNPDTLQKDGVLAFKSAIWFWMMTQCPKPSCHQAMHNLWQPSAGEYSANKMYKNGFAHTNNIINGGLECRMSSSAAFTAKTVLRSDLYKYYMGIMGFDTAQIAAENLGSNSTLCYESITNAMQDYVNCAVVVCSASYSNRTVSICLNQSYLYNNKSISLAGTYYDTFVNTKGCDSIETLTLIVNPQKTTIQNQSICQGDSLYFGKKYLKQSGNYKDTLVASNNCDSIIALTLTIIPKSQTNLSKSICQGDSMFYNNQHVKIAGVYSQKFTSIMGCDSIVTLQLIVNDTNTGHLNKSICQGDSLLYKNAYYKNTGIYRNVFQNQKGCDSVIYLHLTVNPRPNLIILQSNDTLIATSGYFNYKWYYFSSRLNIINNIHQANLSGTYSVEAENSWGCKNNASIYFNKPNLSMINTPLKNSFELFPSPTTNVIFIQGLFRPTNVKIYNYLGVLLMEQVTEKMIDISSLSNGVYWLEIEGKKTKIEIER